MQTIMQSTADAAAPAAVLDLPDQDLALDAAVDYVAKNMGEHRFSKVLISDEDVVFGIWDHGSRTFDDELDPGAVPNAARVILRRTRATDNALSTQLLSLAGVRSWDINVAASQSR